MCVQEDYNNKLSNFMKCMEMDSAHRYRSWDHCYLFFRDFWEEAKIQPPSDENIESACLNLAFYLASWGMYRGSSFLLQKDFTIFSEAIQLMITQKYWDLWNEVYYDELLVDGYDISIKHDKVTKIFDLRKELNIAFNGIPYIKDRKSKRAEATDTLITKILLGAMGCVPAYDNFFKAGLKYMKISPCSSFSRKSLVSVLRFLKDNSLRSPRIPIKDRDGKDSGYSYPLMKMVDMYFWEIGYERYLIEQGRNEQYEPY